MKKLALILTASLALASAAIAKPLDRCKNQPPSLPQNFAIDYTLLGGSVWSHTYTITAFNPITGEFSGTGHFIPDPAYTEIITGFLNGDHIAFHILYTGTNANYTVDALGTLLPNGQISGTAISPGQTFTWTTPQR